MSGTAERVTCAKCGRKLAGFVPAGGDGSVLYPRRHKPPKAWWSKERRGSEACQGSYMPAVPVEETPSAQIIDLFEALKTSMARAPREQPSDEREPDDPADG